MPEGPDDLYNIGFGSTETVFNTELEAQRNANIATSRYWKITNPNSRNILTGEDRMSLPCNSFCRCSPLPACHQALAKPDWS